MIKKLKFIIPSRFKSAGIVLLVYMVIGMLMESLGLGLLLPIVNLIMDPNMLSKHEVIQYFLINLGINTHSELVFFAMVLFSFVFILKTGILLFIAWKQAGFAQSISETISSKLFEGYLRQPYIFTKHRNSATLFRNNTTEVTQFTTVVQNGLYLMSEITIATAIILTLVIIDPIGAISVFLFLGFMGYLLNQFTKGPIAKLGEQRQFAEGKRTLHLLQGFNGFKEVKVFQKENYFLEKYQVFNSVFYKLARKLVIIQQLPRLYLELISVLGLSMFVIVNILNGNDVQKIISILSVIMLASFRLIPSINRILSNIQAVKYALPAIDLIHNELKEMSKNDFKKRNQSLAKMPLNHILRIENLSYRYPDSNEIVLNNISMDIPIGSAIGIIGKSGSGKSTIVDIIIGLLEPNSGRIVIDGNDIQQNIHSWMKNIGYVPQTIYLIDDTLKRNIAFGVDESELDDKALFRAIKDAQLEDFIKELPNGINTEVGERGVKLSGGQRQRIGIARALYNNPQILILDEGTSALDNETESYIMEAISLLKKEKTIILIAHRYSTLVNCDLIYKLQKGVIVEKGTYNQIIETIL